MNIFEVIDKKGKKIKLTKTQWSHIRQRHPVVFNAEDIEESIKNLIKIVYRDDKTAIYYKYFKHRKEPAKFLKVIVNYLNGGRVCHNSLFCKKCYRK